MTPQSEPRLTITAEQAEAVAALARMYMSAETLEIGPVGEFSGMIEVRTHKWAWLISEKGKVAGEGPREDASDAF
jgi:hypothetical protein